MQKRFLLLTISILLLITLLCIVGCENVFNQDVRIYSRNKCEIEKLSIENEVELNSKLQIQRMIERRHAKDNLDFQNAVAKEIKKCR